MKPLLEIRDVSLSCAAVHLTALSVYMALKMSRAKARFAEQVFKL